MNKKIFYIIAAAVVTLLIISVSIYFIFAKKPERSKADTKNLKNFAESFIKDFTTYDRGENEAYNAKLTNYINPDYLSDFKDKFFLPTVINEGNKNDYSRYIESKIEIVKNNYTESVIDITYKATRSDPPNRAEEFTEEKTVTITTRVDKNGFPKITDFQFATNK